MDINYLAPVIIIKNILPDMIERNKGHIVNISSVSCLTPAVKMSEYCASKAALAAFHNAMRLEIKFQKINIMTTLVCPYDIDTGVLERFKGKFKFLYDYLDETTIAWKIYDAIVSNREEVFFPWTYKQTSLFLKLLPVSLSDALEVFIIGKNISRIVGINKKNN